MRAPPARRCSAYDICCNSRTPFAEEAPAAVKSRRGISISGSSSGDDVDQGGNGSKKALEKGNTKTALLDKRRHRRKICNSLGEEDGDEGSSRHQRQPRHAAEGSRSSLFGPGGLLSPWRVRVLLLLQCVILVRTYVGGIAPLVVLFWYLFNTSCTSGVRNHRRRTLLEYNLAILSLIPVR